MSASTRAGGAWNTALAPGEDRALNEEQRYLFDMDDREMTILEPPSARHPDRPRRPRPLRADVAD